MIDEVTGIAYSFKSLYTIDLLWGKDYSVIRFTDHGDLGHGLMFEEEFFIHAIRAMTRMSATTALRLVGNNFRAFLDRHRVIAQKRIRRSQAKLLQQQLQRSQWRQDELRRSRQKKPGL